MKKRVTGLLFSLLSTLSLADVTNYDISKIEIVNNREIPYEVILNNIKSKEGGKYATENMLSDYKSLKELDYVGDVSIHPTVFDNGVKLVIDITERRDTKKLLESHGIIPLSEREKVNTNIVISDVSIIGNSYVSTEMIKSMLPVQTGGYFSQNKVAEGHRNLIESGYFRDVTPDVIKTGKGVKVVYKVAENPVINGINIIGNTIYTNEELMSIIGTEPGKIFNINTIREDRDKIMEKYQRDGYVLAQITDVGLNNNLELEMYISEGIIRNIELKKMVTKQKGARRKATDDVLKTKPYVITRELEFHENEIFNSRAYDETVQNLMRLGHFKNVKYEVRDIPGDPDGKNLVLLLDEERTAVLQGAISYGSEIGLLGMISVKDTNWRGKGQELGFTFEKSDQDYSSFSINFFDPWIKDTNRISWGWSLYKNSYEDDDSYMFREVETLGGRINIGKGLTKNIRLSLGTKLEYVEEKADKSRFAKKDGHYYWTNYRPGEEARGIDDDYFVWSLYPSITYDTRNHFWNPTAGNFAKLQLEAGYANGYEGDVFGNITLELRKYHRGLFKKNTFAYKVVGGVMTDSTKEGQRFWVGGGSTLRGYDGGYYKGTKKLVGTIENRTQFNDIVGLVFFFDAGRAWDYKGRDYSYRHDEKFVDDVAMAAGVGLRLNTPIGPLRFDFGWPIRNKDVSGMEFYFNIGQAF